MPFAGLSLELETFIERTTPPDPAALDRWKELELDGWDVEAVVAVDGSTMVGFGCRYAPRARPGAPLGPAAA